MYRPRVGAIAFVEFFPKGPAAAKRYLEKTFGWKMTKETVQGVDIWGFEAANGPEGHLMAPMGNMRPGTTTAFIRVKSIDDVVRKARKNGGKVVVPKYEVPGAGAFAWLETPGGVVHAVYESRRVKSVADVRNTGKK